MRTFSFYKFCDLTKYEPHLYGGLRSSLLSRLGANGTLGRIYLCQSEGINGLCSVRDPLEFQDSMSACAPELSDLRLNEALEEGSAFLERKLHIRWRKTLVNCGWHNEPKLEKIVSQTSERLGPEQWNSELERDDVVLIDARNSYECEVGKMDSVKAKEVGQGAVRFRDQVDQILEEIGGEVPNKRVLMFCTSGIRCEKLAAILESRGFNNVAHLDGGVTNYVRQARLKGIPVKVVKEVVGNWLSICFQFKGRLFSFDDRLGQTVTDDVLGKCIDCGGPATLHRNCAYVHCHDLNLQCEVCVQRKLGCCSTECMSLLLKTA